MLLLSCMQVAAMQMMFLGEVGAEELLRPYRGVVSYHADAVRHLMSGNCVALQIEVRNALRMYGVIRNLQRRQQARHDTVVIKCTTTNHVKQLLGVDVLPTG